MSGTWHIADIGPAPAGKELASETAPGAGHVRSGPDMSSGPGGVNLAAGDAPGDVLWSIAAGMVDNAGLRALQAGIGAGHQLLGNRAFMRWLKALGADRQAGADAARGVCAPVRPVAPLLVTEYGPLQLMGKKKKKGGAGPEAGTEEASGGAEAGADVRTVPGAAGGEAPVSIPGLSGWGQAPLSEESPVGTEVAGAKKKKKSRVQVALNTLRDEGVTAFRAYLEAEIGEAELLRTLVERITRAENLEAVQAEALRVVEGRLWLHDPAAGSELPGVVAPAEAPGREEPRIAPMKTGLTPREKLFFDSCASGDVRTIKRLLRYRNVDINLAIEHGTVLCIAVHYNHPSVVRELLSRQGIDVNLAVNNGATPLYYAAQGGHAEIVRLLLAVHGINVNLVTKSGATPLYIASQCGHVEVVKQLLAMPRINVNSKTTEQLLTPLNIASEKGWEDIVRLLLNRPGIDIDARTHDGGTPLFIAAQNGFPGIVGALIMRGADVNLALPKGTTPLCIASNEGHDQVVRSLLRARTIDVDRADKNGLTPLLIASQTGNEDIVKMLLRKGACPNKPYSTGITSLHLACLLGYAGIVKLLLSAGADMDVKVTDPEPEAREYTSYRFAELGEHHEVMSVLEAHWRDSKEQAARFEKLSVAEKPGGPTASTETPGPVSAALRAGQAGTDPGMLPVAPVEKAAEELDTPGCAPAGAVSTAPVPSGAAVSEALPSPLMQAKDALRKEVLRKLEQDTLEPLEGIRLLEDVNASPDLDSLCTLYNRLAHIERRKERVRRQGRRRERLPAAMGPDPVAAVAPVFSLGGREGLDADTVEGEVKPHLGQWYHRFVSQAVNDMEFGRGKRTTGYPGLWHVSAGVPGVGSCSVFYTSDDEAQRIRIMGIGHHVGRAAYRLDYADEELGRAGQVLSIA